MKTALSKKADTFQIFLMLPSYECYRHRYAYEMFALMTQRCSVDKHAVDALELIPKLEWFV